MTRSLIVPSLVLVIFAGFAKTALGQAPTEASVQQLLNAGNADQIREGIETSALLGSRRSVEHLAARVRKGLPRSLLEMAVETLGVIGRPEAGPVLFELLAHRRSTVRARAVEAIVVVRPRGAAEALRVALSDSDPSVRGAAAIGLGQLDARIAVDSLFHALDRGVLEASTSIGQLCSSEQVGRFLSYLGRVPFDALSPALAEVLARSDVSGRAKLDVIAKLQELATANAKLFLEDFVASLPPRQREQDLVRQAAEDAILRIAD